MSRTHVYTVDGTPRTCPCGNFISITDRIKEFGLKHDKDLSVWPSKCLSCIVDATISLFESVDVEPLTPPTKKHLCVRCSAKIGGEIKYYQDVPGIGDLCMTCWRER